MADDDAVTRRRWPSMPGGSATPRNLWLGFGTLIVLLVLSSLAIIARVQSFEQNVDGISDAYRFAAEARQLQISTLGYALVVLESARDPDDGTRQRAAGVAARGVDRHLGEYRRLASTGVQRDLANRFELEWRELESLGRALLGADGGAASPAAFAGFQAERAQLETLLRDRIQPDAVAAYEARDRAATRDVRSIVLFALSLLLLGVSVAVATTALISRGVVQRERALFASRESFRKHAEQQLRRSESRKTAMFQAALDCIISIDHEDAIIEFNAAAERTFGYRAEDVIGRPLAEVIVPPAYRDRHRAGMARYLATGEGPVIDQRLELTALRADGTEFPIELTVTRLPGDGMPVFTAYLRDITETRQAATALAVSEARWRGIFERLQEGFVLGEVVHDADGNPVDWRYLEMNAAWEKITGFSMEFVKGRTLRELIPDVEPAWVDDFIAVAQTGVPATFKRHVAALDRWYEVHAFRPEPGRFAALFLDITERQRAEVRLRQSEQRLRFVMDSMPQKICAATATGEVDYYNPEWLEFTGQTFAQMRDWGWTQSVHPDDLAENLRLWQHSIDTGEPFEFEHRFRRADGQYRWHITRARPLRDEAGKVQMWVASNTDIDEQRRAANELRQLADALAEADRRKSEFLAMLAHELRNPLAPIYNALQILRLSNGEGEAVKAMAEIMERQVSQMVRLVDDLLDVSRISRGKIELRKERVELSSIIEQALEASRPAVERDAHRLTVTLPSQPVILQADPVRMIQVFGNLLNNACKFTPPGGRIALSAECDGDEVVVTVKDSGVGIPADLLPGIFEMFTQVDQSLERSQGGLGIGLTLVQRLVELHGGSVAARSAGPGQGSQFSVRLPVMSAE